MFNRLVGPSGETHQRAQVVVGEKRVGVVVDRARYSVASSTYFAVSLQLTTPRTTTTALAPASAILRSIGEGARLYAHAQPAATAQRIPTAGSYWE